MMKVKIIILSLVALVSFNSLNAQESKFSLELNAGFSQAVKEINKSKLKPGFGFEGIFNYYFMPHTGVYAGWGWNRFESNNSFAGSDVCFEETGYIFGLQFKHPIHNSKTKYYLKIGALYNHIETENSIGEIINDSKHGWGWQIGGGLDFNINDKWSFTPGLKFNSLSRTSVFNSNSVDLDYKYLSVKIGFNRKF